MFAKAVMAAIAAAALAAIGCSAPAGEEGHGHGEDGAHPAFDPAKCGGLWHVDRASFERLAPEGLDAISRSAESWDRFSGKPGSLRFDEEVAEGCTIRAALAAEVPEEAATGRYHPADGSIVLVIDRMPACDGAPAWAGTCLGPVILHEVGHGMGLGHLAESDRGIMHPSIMNPWWTLADREACVAAGACAEDPSWKPLGGSPR